MPTALITGASGGIGLELARIHASKQDDVVLIARSADKLQEIALELQSKYQVKARILALDLSAEGAAETVFAFTTSEGIHVDYLINNAGFGDFGLFASSDWEKQHRMIELNITTLSRLCHLYLPAMIGKGRGKIMNVASTAAFQPGPTMAVYYATKAYVLHFSEALSNELQGTGITVTALCPGATESGFQQAAAMEESRLVKGRKLPSSREVAEYGYKAMMRGKTVAIHGWMNFLMANAVRFAPRSITLKTVRFIQDKAGGGVHL
jgi:short-subunit dehydrogenase